MSWFRRSVLDSRMRQRVIVTLHSGEAFSGVLFEADDRAWVLRDAQAIGVGEKRADVSVDGEVLVLAENVAFAQRL